LQKADRREAPFEIAERSKGVFHPDPKGGNHQKDGYHIQQVGRHGCSEARKADAGGQAKDQEKAGSFGT